MDALDAMTTIIKVVRRETVKDIRIVRCVGDETIFWRISEIRDYSLRHCNLINAKAAVIID
jgi:hypothetical protein